jgi:hypothetical protein
MMKKGRRLDWFTPLSGAKSVGFQSLIDDGKSLTLTVVAFGHRTFIFRWYEFCAYRNTLEEHRLPWDLDTTGDAESRPTALVDDSHWIAELRDGNDLMEILHPNARHYAIGSDLYTTEVIATADPEISEESLS